MSDERVRELERRWRESGTVEDEAAYLRERVRVGDLSQERLELAALVGHKAAVDVVGEEQFASRGLGTHSVEPEFSTRTTLALLQPLRFVNRAKLVRHLENWVHSGCPLSGLLSQHASTAWHQIGKGLHRTHGVYRWADLEAMPQLIPTLKACGKGLGADPDKLVRSELVPWALGYGDPVRDRVEARRAARE